jgi:transposase
LSNVGKNVEAARLFEEIQSTWPSRRDVTQVMMASVFIRSQTGRDIRRPISISLTWQWQKLVGAWRKHVSRRVYA